VSLFAKKYLPKEDLLAISNAIADAERSTSGEIRVVARHERRVKEKRLSLHDLALQEFRDLGMEKTSGRTGVLIMILFAERQFYIIADEGIHTKVEEGTWESLAVKMSAHFKEGHYREGIIHTVQETASLLARHFPRHGNDTNELPNAVIEE